MRRATVRITDLSALGGAAAGLAMATKGASARRSATKHVQAGWREIGGRRIHCRSRSEANYGRYLEWLRARGDIKDWAHEPETFWFDGVRRGCVSYKPDYTVTENSGRVVRHEVKGWMDDKSRVKLKRMAKYHPNIVILVITSETYAGIAKTVSGLIAGWE